MRLAVTLTTFSLAFGCTSPDPETSRSAVVAEAAESETQAVFIGGGIVTKLLPRMTANGSFVDDTANRPILSHTS